MKDLPRITRGKISDNLNNTQSIFYSSDRSIPKKDDISIVKKINNIFASVHHVYKSKVRIVGKTSTNLITIDGELINIVDIVDIEKI